MSLGLSLRHRVFARMWGVAALAHLAGNWVHGDVWPETTAVGAVLAAVGLVATATVVRPRPGLLLVLAGLIGVSVALEAPVLGNHWLLAGFVSIAYLVAAGKWERFEPTARVILLAFYTFAAFAKLNTGFFDPSTSCGVYYTDQLLAGYGLGPVGGTLAWAAAGGPAVVELAIPLLLAFRPTRGWGVAAGIGFHGLISLDLNQHFYDFTAVLFALFALFLSDRFFERFEGLGRSLPPRVRVVLAGVVVVVGVAVTVANTTPPTVLGRAWLERGSFTWWVPYLAAVAWSAAGATTGERREWRLRPAGWMVAALVVLNGLTPYLEVKTAYGWNMYSNLVTVAGETNHLVVPSTLPLRRAQYDLVEVVDTDDPGLATYIDEGYLLPWTSFASYVADRPAIEVTFRRREELFHLAAGDRAGLEVRWWWRWLPYRAVHGSEPQRCQPVFLPAL